MRALRFNDQNKQKEVNETVEKPLFSTVYHLAPFKEQQAISGHIYPCKHAELSKFAQNITKLRIWLSVTILRHLVDEFDKIDNEFSKIGLHDTRIGSVSLSHLNQLSQHKSIPSLQRVISFLEMSRNQKALVGRIRDLANGSCMKNFMEKSNNSSLWDSRDQLPTDAVVGLNYCLQFSIVFVDSYPCIDFR